MYCMRCGTQLPDDSAFCRSCGAPQGPGPIPPGAERPPAQSPPPAGMDASAGRSEDDPTLTTRQVADRCRTTESTVQYSARAGKLRGRKVGNRWQFHPSDAQEFCEKLQDEKRSKRRRRGIVGWFRRRRSRARLTPMGVIGGLSSIASLVGEIQTDRFGLGGLILAGFNALWASLDYRRNRTRQPSEEDVVRGEPVDPAAVALPGRRGTGPLLPLAQAATVLLTVVYVATVDPPLLDAEGIDRDAVDAVARRLDPREWFEDGPTATIRPESVAPGQPVRVSGDHFSAGRRGRVTLQGDTMERFRTDDEGRFAVEFAVPSDLSEGSYRVTVTVGETTDAVDLRIVGDPTETAGPTKDPGSQSTATDTPEPSETNGPGPTVTDTPEPTKNTETCLVPEDEAVPPPDVESALVLDTANLRAAPGRTCEIVEVLGPEQPVAVLSGDYPVDGVAWVEIVSADEVRGWVESNLLGPAPTPIPPPDPCAPPGDIAANEWPGGVKEDASLQSGPGPGCPVLRTLVEGEEVTVRTVPYEVDGVSWVKVETGDGELGWVVWSVLNDLTGPE